jgi:hypothetical protein
MWRRIGRPLPDRRGWRAWVPDRKPRLYTAYETERMRELGLWHSMERALGHGASTFTIGWRRPSWSATSAVSRRAPLGYFPPNSASTSLALRDA